MVEWFIVGLECDIVRLWDNVVVVKNSLFVLCISLGCYMRWLVNSLNFGEFVNCGDIIIWIIFREFIFFCVE